MTQRQVNLSLLISQLGQRKGMPRSQHGRTMSRTQVQAKAFFRGLRVVGWEGFCCFRLALVWWLSFKWKRLGQLYLLQICG